MSNAARYDYGMKRLSLTIGGMTCEHCVAAVRDALAALPGVAVHTVDLVERRADVTVAGDVSTAALADAIRKAGYQLQGFRPLTQD